MANHKAITITAPQRKAVYILVAAALGVGAAFGFWTAEDARSEEHTAGHQSRRAMCVSGVWV